MKDRSTLVLPGANRLLPGVIFVRLVWAYAETAKISRHLTLIFG